MANTLRFKRGLVAGIPTGVAGEPLFTTDTFDLYIGNGTTNTRFQKYIASGTTAEYLRGDGSLATFPSLTGFVPYTGATTNVNLGAFDLLVQTLTIGKGNNSLANNTALGYRTLFHITTGNYNTAVGYEAAHNLTTGQYNTAIGQSSMFTATTAGQNTAVGINALLYTTSGGSNVAMGVDALQHNTTGSSNTALGYNAGSHITGGSTSNTTASNSVFIGRDSKALADGQTNQIVIGQNAVGNGSNTATFGNTATTANYFTGSINGGSFVKSGGLSTEYLKADGSVSTLTNPVTGTGVSGQVAYWSGTNTQVGSNLLFWDNANSRLGIGTNAPDFPLSVTGQISIGGVGGNLGIIISNALGTAIPSSSVKSQIANLNSGFGYLAGSLLLQPRTGVGATLVFATEGTEKMRLTSTGNFIINAASTDTGQRLQVAGDGYFSGSVGIGTSPATKLDVVGTIQSQGTHGAGSFNAFIIKNTLNSAGSGKLVWQGNAGNDTWAIAQDQLVGTGFLEFNHTGTNRMVLTSGGNLGLGVTPSAWLAGVRAFEINSKGNAIISSTSSQNLVTANAYFDGAWKYGSTAAASYYSQQSGVHAWFNAISGTINTAITFTQPMTLTANGRLLLGTTTEGTQRLQVVGTSSFTDAMSIASSVAGNFTPLTLSNPNAGSTGRNIFQFTNDAGAVGLIDVFSSTWGASGGGDDVANGMRVLGSGSGGLSLRAQVGTLRFYTGATERMRIDANGSVGIGTTSPAYKLDVQGTLGVTGAATFSSSVTAASLVVDTTTLVVDATNDRVGIGTATPTAKLDVIQSGGTAGISVSGGTNPQMRATDGTITAKVQAITGVAAYIGTESNHQLRLITNNSPRLTIDTTGAATFTSSIAAAGNLLLGSSASTIGAMNLILTGTSPVASRLTFGTDGTGYSFAIGKNQAGTVTDLFSILDSGAANFTTSIQAGTAIAIGTTPDTNKPFKILKNINATVGINFENTSTGSSAFSAIQMGTDVTGGTKFTNLVYASSGVTANGVYQPDGTSLINNGGGGLNFLGTPTRFYTGGSNGVVRLYLDNNGLTQLTATTPTTSETDGYRQYSADVVAGNAAPHFRTENGAVIKIYQETTAVGNSTISVGGGSAVLDDTQFGGYTLRQVVKALQNQGILA